MRCDSETGRSHVCSTSFTIVRCCAILLYYKGLFVCMAWHARGAAKVCRSSCAYEPLRCHVLSQKGVVVGAVLPDGGRDSLGVAAWGVRSRRGMFRGVCTWRVSSMSLKAYTFWMCIRGKGWAACGRLSSTCLALPVWPGRVPCRPFGRACQRMRILL